MDFKQVFIGIIKIIIFMTNWMDGLMMMDFKQVLIRIMICLTIYLAIFTVVGEFEEAEDVLIIFFCLLDFILCFFLLGWTLYDGFNSIEKFFVLTSGKLVCVTCTCLFRGEWKYSLADFLILITADLIYMIYFMD